MLIQTKEEGDLVANALGPKAVAMWMKGHGYNVTGPSVPNAVRAAIELRDGVNILIRSTVRQGVVDELRGCQVFGECARHARAGVGCVAQPREEEHAGYENNAVREPGARPGAHVRSLPPRQDRADGCYTHLVAHMWPALFLNIRSSRERV